jgi:hypothetical protein
MTSAFVYQIRCDASPEGDHDLLPFDNTANERPDWFEYWTMRTFLRTQPLDENAFYGFLSPRFKSKTNLSGRHVHEFIHRHVTRRTCSCPRQVRILQPNLNECSCARD